MAEFDTVAGLYLEMVRKGGPRKAYEAIIKELSCETGLNGKRICDIGCGPGELAFRLCNLGGIVTGVDSSAILLSHARNVTDQVEWMEDDAMTLGKIQDETFDIAVSSLMLMDVPDYESVFKQSYRVLKHNAIMIWLVMHPCFQSPFSHPEDDGSRKVYQYAPQYWKSKGNGTLRSIAGSYHRPVSYYINNFMKTGFALLRTFEPGSETAFESVPMHFGAIGRKI
ncbi:class I SAM-dependent methyltransferase [Paenibacillus alkalitolerans]|uniref:class I SAM-dependent methyltransferase n=1 Tax=Paenibacillus alkalitolerans TaxID=2799335 RepID=UPI0018F34230|nr:class I SAM-dependent methyltransferase [Paenibacillus alkalitolerans]